MQHKPSENFDRYEALRRQTPIRTLHFIRNEVIIIIARFDMLVNDADGKIIIIFFLL